MRTACKIFAAMIAVSSPAIASAAPAGSLRPFAESTVSDEILGETRGSGTPFGYVSRRQVSTNASNQLQFDSRMFGTIGRIQMDVWWGSVGSQLIANAVRAQQP